jgi:hypothetical protein
MRMRIPVLGYAKNALLYVAKIIIYTRMRITVLGYAKNTLYIYTHTHTHIN